MNKWNLIIDVAKCHDCNNCFLACKDEFYENDFPTCSVAQPRHGHRWINIMRKERGQHPQVDVAYLPLPCMHCDEADCVKAAENDAVYQRDDGIVIIDPEKSKGQRAIVDSCPYGVIWWNDELEVPQKCTFCAHLLDEGWGKPRCVQSCPTGALEVIYVTDDEMFEKTEAEDLEVFHPEYGLKPRVFYKNLYRYDKYFIAGSVVLKDVDECAEGAQIVLKDNSGKVLITAEANNYGDFKFDNIVTKAGKYSLEVEYPGYAKQEVSVELTESTYIGAFFLE